MEREHLGDDEHTVHVSALKGQGLGMLLDRQGLRRDEWILAKAPGTTSSRARTLPPYRRAFFIAYSATSARSIAHAAAVAARPRGCCVVGTADRLARPVDDTAGDLLRVRQRHRLAQLLPLRVRADRQRGVEH